MNTLELINRLERLICLPESNYNVPIFGNSKVCVTNGHIVVILNQPQYCTNWNHNEEMMTHIESAVGVQKEPVTISIPEIPVVACWLEANKMVKGICGECNGTGVVVCEYDHEHECPECNGTGATQKTAIYEWHGAVDRYHETEAGLFDRRYLWILSEIAKYRTVSYGTSKAGDGTLLGFEFEDGFGGVLSVIDRKKYSQAA